MDNLFNTIRRIHLYSAVLTSSFLLMYFLSGGVLIMNTLFPRALKEILTEQVSINGSKPQADNIAEICQRFNIHGEETIKDIAGSKKSYSYYRPAYRAEILIDGASGTAKIKIAEGKIWSVMNDFHRLRGYTGNWAHQIWSLFYDLSCISLIVLALTGVYLWWKKDKKKRFGILFLFASTGVTLFTILYMLAIC